MKLPFWPNPSNYHKVELGLDRVYQLLERVGNPHLKLPPIIHIAGTNGKGSTLAYLKAIFEDANYLVSCYTSPHLVNFNERIILAGKEISNDFLNKVLTKCQQAAEIEPRINITFFEGITVAAFLAFSQIKSDILLLETGMGGRLDATNVINDPLLTIITSISLDHTEFLGKTLKKIAAEKAGIIKRNSPTIISKQKILPLKKLQEIAIKNNSLTYVFGSDWKVRKIKNQILFLHNNIELKLPRPNLAGEHQIINAGNAIMAVLAQKKFKITYQNIANGLQKASWKARLQKIVDGKFYNLLPENDQKIEIFLDGGHNKDGAKTISNWLKIENKKTASKNYFICAMLRDKDSPEFIKQIAKQAELLVGLEIEIEGGKNSKTAEDISTIARNLKINSKTALGFSDAINKINNYHQQHHSGIRAKIIICGSLYLAGKFLEENFNK